MPAKARLLAHIDNAAGVVTPVWPLRSFIATNPLAGFESLPFPRAVAEGKRRFRGRGYPSRTMGQQALRWGEIDLVVLKAALARHNREDLYEAMVKGPVVAETPVPSPASALNRLSIKWLTAFLDEGQSAWPMPGREQGFYRAWKALAVHDGELPDAGRLRELPDDTMDALVQLLRDVPESELEELLAGHLAALPGWAGFIRWRANQDHYVWQQAHPISLGEYLAVRLAINWLLGEPQSVPAATDAEVDSEGLIWLEALEESYRGKLIGELRWGFGQPQPAVPRAEAQLVFCIDVRSEVLRRHLERSGPFQTLGFAGFFGIPVAFRGFTAEQDIASCPVLLSPKYTIGEQVAAGHEHAAHAHRQGHQHLTGLRGLLYALKSNIAAPFAYVETAGSLFGVVMAGRTLFPEGFQSSLRRLRDWLVPQAPLEPTIHLCGGEHGEEDILGVSLEEQIFFAEAGLRVMGLTENFAPLVVLCGHGGETVNNPYAAGLDCGACGGNPGGPNARIMAAIYNDSEVRAGLAERGIVIPDDTRFAAGEHNTTTDEVRIYQPEKLRQHNPLLFDRLQAGLAQARRGATAERSQRLPNSATPDSVFGTRERAADWAQVRPEWGLARNAAFIVGPRDLTRELDLQGRTFLHSYDWRSDPEGKALEIILTAPMVVAEWINTQYYFSTVDNGMYGSGSKVTHNVVGKLGVMQGNASDLMSGLPLQSLMSADGELYHQPLRLMTVVQAPLDRVAAVIERNDILQTLFNHGWVALTVIDPDDGRFLRYQPGLQWLDTAEQTPTPVPAEAATLVESV